VNAFRVWRAVQWLLVAFHNADGEGEFIGEIRAHRRQSDAFI